MSDVENAVLDWLHTFDAGKACEQIQDLSDGTLLGDILHEMCPDFFDTIELNRNCDGNWALAVSNIRTILRSLDDYFKTVLGKKVDVSSVDANEIGRLQNLDEILNLVELVVGVAVMCESKAVFIRNIFLLNPDSQAVLKEFVEHVLGRATDLEEDTEESVQDPSNIPSSSTSDEELLRAKEMLQHLQNERQRLLADLRNSELANENLKSQVASLKEKSSFNEQEREAFDGTERQRNNAAEQLNAKLQKELDECKKDLDLKIVESDNLRSELRVVSQRLEASREIQAKLEIENHQQADELDVARDKLSKLAKAEQSVEKYQKKLEEMMVVKKQNKELSDKIDQYLDQIHELESTNKGFSNLNKMVENYKNRAIELEREKFEAISNAEVYQQQAQQYSQELKKLSDTKNRLEDENRSLQSQIQLFHEQEEEKKPFSGLGIEEEGTESVAELKEKIKKLERQLKHPIAESVVSTSDTSSQDETASISLLHQELDQVRAIKKEREEALVAAKRQIAELQTEITKLQRSREETEKESTSSQSLKEVTQKLAATSNTVKLLEERLKERETLINKLQQEKSKLEGYAKRSLETFKEKYLSVLQTMQQEKKELIDKIRVLTEKAEKNQDTLRREERLLSSALFEVGIKIMDRKILSQLNEPVPLSQNTFIGMQREAVNKSASDVRSQPQSAGIANPLFASPK